MNYKDLFVRGAVPDDLESLVQIKPSAAVHRDRLRDAAAGYMQYFVLEWEHCVIGFACLVFRRPPHWSDGGDTSHLPQVVDIVIAPSLRGHGFGSFFLRGMERLATERGYQELYLSVDPMENPRAHALYQRLGYQPPQRAIVRQICLDHGGSVRLGMNLDVACGCTSRQRDICFQSKFHHPFQRYRPAYAFVFEAETLTGRYHPHCRTPFTVI